MINFFKSNPEKKLQKQYEKVMEQAMLAQRNGKIEDYGKLIEEAKRIEKDIDSLIAAPK